MTIIVAELLFFINSGWWQLMSALRQASQRFLISHLHTATIFHIEICQVQAGLDMLSATFTLRCQMSRDSALNVFITEWPMVNLKGLYNIMQLSRCLTHYIISNNWISEFLSPNVDNFFGKWVSYPSGHNLALRTSYWKFNNTKHSNIKLHGPTKLKSELKKIDLQMFC